MTIIGCVLNFFLSRIAVDFFLVLDRRCCDIPAVHNIWKAAPGGFSAVVENNGPPFELWREDPVTHCPSTKPTKCTHVGRGWQVVAFCNFQRCAGLVY